MGQEWKFISIDKNEAYGPLGNMGCFFFEAHIPLLKLLVGLEQPIKDPVVGKWAGDRIICLGEYATRLPQGVITRDDTERLNKLLGVAEHNSQISDSLDDGVCDLGERLYDKADKLFNIYSIGAYRLPKDLFPDDAIWTLRNLSKREYIRSDTISPQNCKRTRHRALKDILRLFQALVMRTGWSADDSSLMEYAEEDHQPSSCGPKVIIHRGEWAGDRIDVVMLTGDIEAVLPAEGWRDVTGEAARQLNEICEIKELEEY